MNDCIRGLPGWTARRLRRHGSSREIEPDLLRLAVVENTEVASAAARDQAAVTREDQRGNGDQPDRNADQRSGILSMEEERGSENPVRNAGFRASVPENITCRALAI